MKNSIELSVVIPCLNEEKTLPIVIDKALKSFARLGITGEVVVSDNGSTDNSTQVAEKGGARVVHCPKKGYGNALICGMENAFGQYIIMGDADDSYNFTEIDEFVYHLREGNDIVMGTRLRGKIEEGAMPFLHRYLGTPVLTFVLNRFFGTAITDCNCGLRGLTKKTFEKLQMQSGGMEFASEMIIKAGILDLGIKEIPITLYKDKRGRPPHLNTWRDGWRHLKFMLLYAPNFLFIWPSVILISIGTMLMLLQINGAFIYGRIFMDIHFMIFGLTLAILGVSYLQMGMVIKLFSHLNNYYTGDRLVGWFTKSFSLEWGLILGGVFFFAGFAADMAVLIDWVSNGYKDISMPRLAIYGLYLIYLGASIVGFSFLWAIMRKD